MCPSSLLLDITIGEVLDEFHLSRVFRRGSIYHVAFYLLTLYIIITHDVILLVDATVVGMLEFVQMVQYVQCLLLLVL